MVTIKWYLQAEQVQNRIDLYHGHDRVILIVNKYHNNCVRIKWHLLPKQVENRVNLHHDSDKDEEISIEIKQISRTIVVKNKLHLQSKQVETE